MPRSRKLVVATFSFVLLLFASVEGRLFYLQVMKSQSFRETLSRYHRGAQDSKTPRGSILDRNGMIVAASLPSRQVEVWRPNISKRRAEHLESRLSSVFPVTDIDLESPPPQGDGKPRRVVLSDSVVDSETLWALEGMREKRQILGVDILNDYQRCYPQGDLFGPLLGFIDVEQRGVFGLEKAFQAELASSEHSRALTRDAKNIELFEPLTPSQSQRSAGDVYLTIDSRVQKLAGEAVDELTQVHGATRAVVIVTNPKSGEIVAMAQSPRFDPDRLGGEMSTWRNFAIQDTYEPGSSFKPFTMAMALEKGVVHPEQRIDCDGGRSRFGRRTVVDVKAMDEVPAREVIVHSSNVGISKIFQRMVSEHAKRGSLEFQPIQRKLRELGFGSPIGMPMPGESQGHVTSLSKWSRNYTLVSVAFGYEISLTAVQMAQAFSVFANRGILQPLKLIDSVRYPDGRECRGPEPAPRRIFREETTRAVMSMMEEVVNSGTGKRCKIDGLRIAGKTGSSVPPKEHRDTGTKTANFVCLAPAEDPELLVLVNAHRDAKKGNFYGGEVAAPIAKQLLDGSFEVLQLR